MTVGKYVLAVITILLFSIPTISVVERSTNGNSDSIEIECHDFYFLNAIYVKNTTLDDYLYLETPANLSLGNINQSVTEVTTYNVRFNESAKLYEFKISNGSSFYGYFVSKVRLCIPRIRSTFNIVMLLLTDPEMYKGYEEIPENISKQYLREPHELVVKIVKRDFEEWLRERGWEVRRLSKAGLAIYAAYFIYNYYIRYNASPYPRTIEEVIKSKSGDCDDMSRVLVNLLWSYGIPAAIAHGYVVIRGFTMDVPIENTTYVFRGLGPHAFTLAYVPPLGWISLDFLAGSLIEHPFVFENISVITNINKTAVEEFKNMSKRLDAVQLFKIFTVNEFYNIKEVKKSLRDAIAIYINKTLGIERLGMGITLTYTTSPQSSTATNTIETTLYTSISRIEITSSIHSTTSIERSEIKNRTHTTTVYTLYTPRTVLPLEIVIVTIVALTLLAIHKLLAKRASTY